MRETNRQDFIAYWLDAALSKKVPPYDVRANVSLLHLTLYLRFSFWLLPCRATYCFGGKW
jgi:hypothetical protein